MLNSDTSEEFIVRWYIPQLAEWVTVGTYRRIEQARSAEDLFHEKLRKNWSGEIRTAVLRSTEEEV